MEPRPREMTVTCAYCGDDFTYTYRGFGSYNKYCCDECRKQATAYKSHLATEARKRSRQEQAEKEKAMKPKESLDQANAKAIALGMSYGEYMAKEYSKMVKVERRKNGAKASKGKGLQKV